MFYDLTKEIDVVSVMRSSASQADWNDNCDRVKAVNNGYPPFWYSAIVMSGVAFLTSKEWKNK